jgi:hypothetical protein
MNKQAQTDKQETKQTNTQKPSRFSNNRISVSSSGVTPSASSPGVGI